MNIDMSPCTTYLSGRVLRKVAVRGVLEVTLVSRRVIGDVHLPLVIHPQAPHNDIVHCRRHLPPGVMAAGFCEGQMCNACKQHTNYLFIYLFENFYSVYPCVSSKRVIFTFTTLAMLPG
jgi:hypothetical protein